MSFVRKASRASLGLEPLEDRLALSWPGAPPASISPPAATSVFLDGNAAATGQAAISGNEVDYFSFVATRTGGYRITALTPASNLDTLLGVFNASGQRIASNDDIGPANFDSQVSLSLRAGQRYYFGVTNSAGTPGGRYTWSVNGPAAVTDDSYEDNDSFSAARSLGPLTARRTLTNLVMADAADWFRFTTNGPGSPSSYVSIAFTHARGDLDLRLFDASGNLIRYSDTTGNAERVSLGGLAAGTYSVQVYGYKGARNPSYSLDIMPGLPPASTVRAGSRVLYLNFDGRNISRAELQRWAGTDWASEVNDLDADRNGINVRPFLAGRSDRDQVIARMIGLLQEDLRPFGITVQRITGGAVEGVGATTIFLGPSTLSNDSYHVACTVDQGNDDRTDVAFVGDEDWGTAERTALALADTALHEAGHTWGLWHVSSGTYPETMGLRYSAGQGRWAQNTSFVDRTFAAYVDPTGYAHGPGPQNSYRVMLQTFGGGSAANLGFTADTSQPGVFTLTLSGARADLVTLRRLASGNIAVVVNGRVYELQRGYRQVVVYTDGDRRDRVRVLNNLGRVRLRVNRAAGAEVPGIAKGNARQADLWNGQRQTAAGNHNLGCGCPLCRGGMVTARGLVGKG